MVQHGPRISSNSGATKVRKSAWFFLHALIPQVSPLHNKSNTDMLYFIEFLGKFYYYAFSPQSRTGSFAQQQFGVYKLLTIYHCYNSLIIKKTISTSQKSSGCKIYCLASSGSTCHIDVVCIVAINMLSSLLLVWNLQFYYFIIFINNIGYFKIHFFPSYTKSQNVGRDLLKAVHAVKQRFKNQDAGQK